MIEVELKELQKIKAELDEALAKISKFYKKHDDGSELADDALKGLNLIKNTISKIDSWLEEYVLDMDADNAKLEKWKQWVEEAQVAETRRRAEVSSLAS